MRVLAQWQIVARTGGTLLIFILVRDENDYLTAVLIQSSIILAAGAIVSAKALSLLGHVHKTNFTAIARQLREGWSVFLGTGAVTLYTTSNVLVVGLMAGNIQAGYYSAAEKMLMPVISVLIGVFGQALFPRIGALVHQDRSHALIFIRKVVVSFAVLGGVASIAVFSLASFAAKLIFGPQFLDTVTILKILSPLCLLIALSNAFGIQIMIPFGFQREFGRILLFAGLLHLISLLAASHFFGATGAAVSVVVTEGIVTLIMAASLLRRGIFSIENSSKASST
jgi:O-antigen/teichoic acid export membrane protein